MTSGIGVWEPKKAPTVDIGRLRHYVDVINSADPTRLADAVPAADIQKDAGMMTLPADQWVIAEPLTTDELVALIRFFTLAEMQFTGWDGGKDSPVIPLVRMLKSRDGFTADLRKWIKANTDNRYLPYGSAF